LETPIDSDNRYVLHYAFWKKAPSATVIKIINYYPMAVQRKYIDGCYPLHYACFSNQSESVIQLLINKYPMAVQQKDTDGWYPLHLACIDNQSENVILALIDINLFAVKANDQKGYTPLQHAKWNGQSKKIIDVLETIMEKSDDDLKNRIDIPMIVLTNGFYNRRRHDGFQWLLMNKPTKQIQGFYVQEQQP
jgi:hypothetical protein